MKHCRHQAQSVAGFTYWQRFMGSFGATSALDRGDEPGLAAALLGALAQSALPLLSLILSNQRVG